MCVRMYIYIYIYIERERERRTCVFVCASVSACSTSYSNTNSVRYIGCQYSFKNVVFNHIMIHKVLPHLFSRVILHNLNHSWDIKRCYHNTVDMGEMARKK